MSFKVLSPGLMSTLQDFGRQGYQKEGVNNSGAMDIISLRLANMLVGNDEHEAALEITLAGPTLEFTADTLIAITGADLSPMIDGISVKMNRPVAVVAGSVLKFGGCLKGCRAYLSMAGGYDVPMVMGSKSTYVRGSVGGYQGRALAKGDVLGSGQAGSYARHLLKYLLCKGARSFRAASWYVSLPHLSGKEMRRPIGTLQGLQMGAFSDESLHDLLTKQFTITNASDRMGYRLEGPRLLLKEPLEMISEIAVFGTVQVPADGNPIILMADHQSIAGYPKIAQVIGADLPRLAQMRPGTKISFREVPLKEAEEQLLEMERYLSSLKIALKHKA